MRKKILITSCVVYLGVIGLFFQIRIDRQGAQQRLARDLVFPLATTKSDITRGSDFNGQTLIWYADASKSYHHDYAAADIHVNEGTVVLAAKGGQVVAVRSFDACDTRHFPAVTIRGVDGFYYYYTHLKPGSIRASVGEQISTGDPFAKVGSAICAQGSAPHLHLDVSRFPFAFRGGFWGQVTLIDPQSALVNAYQELSQK